MELEEGMVDLGRTVETAEMVERSQSLQAKTTCILF